MYRRNYVALYVHLVWGTWDRQPLLNGTIQQQIYRAIGAKCTELGASMVALGGVEDHIHLLVLLPSTLTVSNLVGQVKGVSSHLVNHQGLMPQGEMFKWQGTYGAFSVSQSLVREVAHYIQHQREHHASGMLRHEWEEPGAGTPAGEDAPEAAP